MPTLEQVDAAWHRSVIPCVRAVSIPVAALLVEARPVLLLGRDLMVEFPPEMSFHANQCRNPRNKDILNDALHEITGRRFRIRIICDGDPQLPAVETYDDYLRSDHWQHMRALAKEHYGTRCVLCGRTDTLDVHHRTYERKGRELLGDLILLCRNCHSTYHQKAS